MSVFTKAMSVHRVSPALSLQAVFQKKLASYAGKNNIRGVAKNMLSQIASSILVCCCGARETVV